MEKPTWNKAGDEFSFLWEEHGVAAVAEILKEDTTGIWAEVMFATNTGGHLLQRRLNLMASRSQADVAKELIKRSAGTPWDKALEQLCVIVVREWRKPPDQIDLEHFDVTEGPIYQDSAGLFARGEPNIIVAPGESNKSTFVLATAVAFKYGVTLAHIRPLYEVRPVFLDWEDNPDVAAARVRAIKAGLCITTTTPFPYYHLDRPLYEASRWLRAVVQRQRINMVYVDSAVPASGSEPESADAAQRLHRALRSFGPDVTSEITAHMSKGDMEKLNGGVFGSVMGPNLARSVWQVVKGEEDEEEGIQHGETREFTIALIQRKNNLGRRRRFGLRVSWEGREYEHPRVIRFTEARIADDPSLADRAGLKTLIANALKKQGKMTIDEIAEWTGANLHSVKSTLRRMDDVVRIDEGGQGGRGKKTAWGLRAHQNDDHVSHH